MSDKDLTVEIPDNQPIPQVQQGNDPEANDPEKNELEVPADANVPEIPHINQQEVQLPPIPNAGGDLNFDPDLPMAIYGVEDEDARNTIGEDVEPIESISPKRRLPTNWELLKIRREEKRLSDHKPMLRECGCKSVCNGKIGRDRWSEINSWYWGLSGTEQKAFIPQFTKRIPVKRRRSQVDCATQNYRRQFSYEYQLEDE